MDDSTDAESNAGSKRTTPTTDCSVSKKRRLDKQAKLLEKNPAAEFIINVNKLYSQLIARQHDNDRENRVQECIDYIDGFDVTDENAFAAKARLKSVCRCLQLCLKYGNLDQRKFIFDRIQSKFPDFALNEVGSHLAKKLIKYVSAEQQQQLADIVLAYKPSSSMLFGRFSSGIIDQICELDPPFDALTFRRSLLRLLAIPSTYRLQLGDAVETLTPREAYHRVDSRGKEQMHEKLISHLTKFADKDLTDRTYVHQLVDLATELADTERLKSIYTVLENKLVPLLQTHIGSIALVRLIDVMEAKARRNFVSELKQQGVDMKSFVKNAASSPAFLRLVTVTDDTQLTKKQLLAPAFNLVKNNISDISEFRETLFTQPAQRVYLTLLGGFSPRWIPVTQKELFNKKSPTSKKDNLLRRKECLELLYDPVCSLLASDLSEPETLLKWFADRHAREVVWATIAAACSSVTKNLVNPDAAANVVDAIVTGLKALADAGRLFEILDPPTCNSSLTQILRIGAPPLGRKGGTPKAATAEFLTGDIVTPMGTKGSFVASLFAILKSNLETVVQSRGIFLLADTLQLVKGKVPDKKFESIITKLGKMPQDDSPGWRLIKEQLF